MVKKIYSKPEITVKKVETKVASLMVHIVSTTQQSAAPMAVGQKRMISIWVTTGRPLSRPLSNSPRGEEDLRLWPHNVGSIHLIYIEI